MFTCVSCFTVPCTYIYIHTHAKETSSHMEEDMSVADTHMEELVEHSGSMAAEAGGVLLREPYHADILLAPEADFIVGQCVSISSFL